MTIEDDPLDVAAQHVDVAAGVGQERLERRAIDAHPRALEEPRGQAGRPGQHVRLAAAGVLVVLQAPALDHDRGLQQRLDDAQRPVDVGGDEDHGRRGLDTLEVGLEDVQPQAVVVVAGRVVAALLPAAEPPFGAGDDDDAAVADERRRPRRGDDERRVEAVEGRIPLEGPGLRVIGHGGLERLGGLVLGEVVVADDEVERPELAGRELRQERGVFQDRHQNASSTELTTDLAKSTASRSSAFEFWPRKLASEADNPVVTSYSSLKVWAGFS